jgi:hypothetical protein
MRPGFLPLAGPFCSCGRPPGAVYLRATKYVHGMIEETNDLGGNERETTMVAIWLKELDDVLRGHKADPRLLASGTTHVPIQPLVGASILLGMAYGVCMGLYAVATRAPASPMQMIACAVKVPALFFLTLVVTFPSLYVFSALLGVRLNPKDTLRLILVPITVNLAVLASLGTITAFFTLSTTSYHFMTLLNVVFFTVSGVIGLKILLTMLSRLEEAQRPRAVPGPISSPADSAGPPEPAKAPTLSRPQDDTVARATFRVWVVIYALVGAQMGWILRPFIGAPNLPFAWFRHREANIFIAVIRTIQTLLGL